MPEDTEEGRTRSGNTLAPSLWRSTCILDAVCQVNEHLVNVLVERAVQGDGRLAIVAENLDILSRLDADSRRRVARMPVLLLDLNFQDNVWWRSALVVNSRGRWIDHGALILPTEIMMELTRESLIIAWLAVRDARRSTRLLFGMSDEVASTINALTPQQLNRISDSLSRQLRIRWEERPDFWRELLAASRNNDAAKMLETHIRGLQLLGADFIQ